MDVSRAEKKLREARFFLAKLCGTAPHVDDGREEFDYLLSAFHNAAATVKNRMSHDHGSRFKTFYSQWEAGLTPQDAVLIKFMADDRNLETHEKGSQRDQEDVVICVWDSWYRDDTGTNVVSAPPGLTSPPLHLYRQDYRYMIDGVHVRVIVACNRYLDLLEAAVRDFVAANT
jgi:hypothetical protein